MDSSQETLYDLNDVLFNQTSPPDDNNDIIALTRIPTEELLQADLSYPMLSETADSGYYNNSFKLENYEGTHSVTDSSPEPEYSCLQKLPSLEETDLGFEFEVGLNGNSSGKGTWMYSSKMKKIFVKNRTEMNIIPTFTPPTPSDNQTYFLRAMIVPVSQDDATVPLKVCPNHRASDPKCPFAAHILRCKHPLAFYDGSEEGYYWNNRLQVVVPLTGMAPKEPVIYMFQCQNSCSGGMQRKATAIIFALEDQNKKILGKRILNFKVCSCPKRDKEKEERGTTELPKKRKIESPMASSSKKIPKIKQEPVPLSSQSSTDSQSETFDNIKMEIVFPNRDIANHVIDCAYNSVAAQIQNCADRNEMENLKNIQSTYTKNKDLLKNGSSSFL